MNVVGFEGMPSRVSNGAVQSQTDASNARMDDGGGGDSNPVVGFLLVLVAVIIVALYFLASFFECMDKWEKARKKGRRAAGMNLKKSVMGYDDVDALEGLEGLEMDGLLSKPGNGGVASDSGYYQVSAVRW